MGAMEAVIRLKRRLSASALRITMPPPSGHSGRAANWPAPDHTTADIRIAAGGEIPAGPVLAPKMAPRIKVLGRNVSAARKPAATRRDTPGIESQGTRRVARVGGDSIWARFALGWYPRCGDRWRV